MVVSYEEKRSYYRMAVDCQVEFSAKPGEPLAHKGEGRNLSATGVKFVTSEKLSEAQELDMLIHPILQTVAPLQAKAKVARVEEEEEGKYIVAVELTDVK